MVIVSSIWIRIVVVPVIKQIGEPVTVLPDIVVIVVVEMAVLTTNSARMVYTITVVVHAIVVPAIVIHAIVIHDIAVVVIPIGHTAILAWA